MLKSNVMKRAVAFMITMILTINTFAQEITVVPNNPLLYQLTAFGLLISILVVVVAIYSLKIVNMLNVQIEKDKALRLGITHIPKPSWWSQVVQQMNASIPVAEEKNIELDHNYDGIKELDNHLPPWWKWLFYGTIGFAAVYIIVFHFSGALPLQEQEYQTELAVAEEQAKQFIASQPRAEIDGDSLIFAPDPAILEKGKTVFAENNCGACHRNDGGGNNIGPNLTDEFWLHGGEVKQVFYTVKDGVVEKGMPAWGKSLSAHDVRDVTFYVLSLQGSNPANAKAPQGEPFKSASIALDSTKVQASL
jgi:cytochrome c oxidase cbb3-type subunit 3